jgi:lipopolysaccharide assembly outer membrane protein LptD (OstA)
MSGAPPEAPALPETAAKTPEASAEPAPSNTAAAVETGPEGQPPAADADAAPAAKPAGKGLSAEFVLERDIATSSLRELAEWCRSLGLSEAGTREEMASRLRDHYTPEPPPVVPGEGAGDTAVSGETAEGTEAAGLEGTGEAAAEAPGPVPLETQKKEPILITIESAKTTEYFTIEAVHENYVRLKGSVSIVLRDGEVVHRIKADELLYNRTLNRMSASGGVQYIKEEGDTIETFRGEGITVDLDNWSTVFMEGSSDKALTEGESQYRFAGEIISRSGEDSTVLRHAEIRNANDEDAFWSISASKLWLLPGSDWAVFNAVLKVGEIPVLYLPAFYYPADELFFHPVIGFRSREGSYLQTTTYLLGRPKAVTSSESSISTIMGSGAGMEKKREGVFLRSTGKKVRDAEEVQLALLADAYVNLGYYLGTELTVPGTTHFGETQLSAGLVFSRDVIYTPMGYTPFIPADGGTSNWNSSRFFAWEVPFRFRFVNSGSVRGSGGPVSSTSLSWNFPFYSDPYVDNDFLHRSEDSDFLTMIQSATTTDETTYTDSLGAYEWQLNGNLTFSIPPLSPYVSSLSISSATSSLAFNSRTNSSSSSYSPERTFFYPQKFTLYSLSASIGGTLLNLGGTEQAGTEQPKTEQSEDILKRFGIPISPWGTESGEKNDGQGNAQIDAQLRPPAIKRTAEAIVIGGNSLVMDYRLNPAAASEMQFNAAGWQKPEDIDWGDLASQLFSFRADGNLGLTFSEKRGLYTTSLRFSGASSWQQYSYLNTNAQGFDAATATRQAHDMTYFTGSAEYTLQLKPFYKNAVWENTSFQYTLKGLLVKTNYDSVNDSWSLTGGKWDRSDIEIHRFQANINASIRDKIQSLLITADLPPEESALGAEATARIWISETNARTRIREPFSNPVFEPAYLTQTLRFGDRVSLRQYVVYDPQYSEFTILTTSLSLWDVNASFSATRSKSYELVSDTFTDPSNRPTGWYENAGEALNIQEMRLTYDKTFSVGENGPLIFSLNINTGLTFDLQRYTYSKFIFTLGINININRFLDFTLRSYSENAVVYRYLQDLPFFKIGVNVPGEKNPLVDLLNSFRFDNSDLRKASGFKLKSFGLDMTHHLGDWDAILGMTLTPELDRNSSPPAYMFNTVISFVIRWKPISELKTEMNYDREGFRYK